MLATDNRSFKTVLLPVIKEYSYCTDFCRRIRHGFNRSVDIERMKRYSSWFFSYHLKDHFLFEEDMIYPKLGQTHKTVSRSLAYNRKLRRLFIQPEKPEQFLWTIEEELESCIRYKKDNLLKLMMEKLNRKELHLMMKIYMECIIYEDWGDRFWEQQKLN